MVPANIPGVVAVSGIDKAGDFASESSFGPEVVIAAPGMDMITPVPLKKYKEGYARSNGTSFATGVVSGVVALIRSKYPKLNAASVIERLIRTSRDNGEAGRDKYFGFGTVRPYQALTDKVAPVKESSLGVTGGTSSSPSAEALPTTSTAGKSAAPKIVLVVVAFVVLLAIVLVSVIFARRRKRAPVLAGSGPIPPGGWQKPSGYAQQRGPYQPPSGYPHQQAGFRAPPPSFPPPDQVPPPYGPPNPPPGPYGPPPR